MKSYETNKTLKSKEQNKILEFRGITRLIINGNYTLAITALEEYLQKYPGNSYGIKEYASILRQQKMPEEALKILEQSKENAVHIRRERAYSYILMEEYEKALEELSTMPKTTNVIEKAKSYCRAKLNRCSEIELSNYYVQQFSSYSEQKAIEYISANPYTEFSKNINIEQLYYNIQSILENATPIITRDFLKEYYFRIPQIGQYKDELTNYLLVITTPDSLEILNMVPAKVERNIFINNYEKLLEDQKKQQKEFATVHELLKYEEQTLAKTSLENYIKKYSTEISAIKEYILLLEKIGDKEGFSFLEQYVLNEGDFGVKNRIYTYIYMKEYQKALDEIRNIKNKTVSSSKRIDQARNYIYAKTGNNDKISGDFYTIEQTKCYSKEKALEHIENGHLKNKKEGKSYFSKGIDIKHLYDELAIILPKARLCRYHNDSLPKTYNFYLENVGYYCCNRISNMPVDYFRVVTLPDSYDILTMFPTNLSIDANNYEELLKEKENKKIKVKTRQSQIDKFNQRYGFNK